MSEGVGSEKVLCNICMTDFDSNDIIRLKCNPKEHTFCYDCILDWFKTINKKDNKYIAIEYKKRECPICRKTAQTLPLREGYKYIDTIHTAQDKPNESTTGNILNLFTDELNFLNQPKCSTPLLSGKGLCKNIGKYNGKCGIHKNIIIPDNFPICNTSFKSGNGLCQKIGKYNGKCGVHKNNIMETITEESKETNKSKETDAETTILCGIVLKSGKGTCKNKGKQELNGCCGIHSKK